MTAPSPRQAARQVIAGDPRASARAWLWPLLVVVVILFALDTYLVATRPLLPFDVPVARWVQTAPWGPVTYAFELINATAGYVQVAVGVIAVVILFVWDRRAGYLMAIGAASSLIDNGIKLAMARQRPSADLVHILTPAPGYSYPSGHAVFFTWLCFMLAFALAPHVRPAMRGLLWAGAAVVIALACLARVWAGAHWPSDVLGGFLLGLGWSAFVVWLPERWLPSPSWGLVSWTRRLDRFVDPKLAVVAAAAALAAAALTVYVVSHPFIPQDAAVERDVQATAWGPLAYTFPFFSWIGDAKGFVAEVIVFVAILIFNRRAWLVAAGAAFTGVLYIAVSHVILRPRPTVPVVLQVTEHPGASSFPSGHTMFIVTLTTVLMLCFGRRFLPPRLQWAGWTLVVLIVAANGIARIYTGAHWPSDVLGAILIAVAWLSFWVSLRFVSTRAAAERGRARRREGHRRYSVAR